MLILKKIAITGGVASGKSTVSNLFKEFGAYVVDSDKIVHELLLHDTNIWQQIVSLLGEDIIVNGSLHRRKIAAKVFKNSELLHALEKILHPAVLTHIKRSYLQACQSNCYSLFVAEVPLLYEINGDSFFDAVITVLSPENVCKERFRKQGHTDIEYDERMQRQLSSLQKANKATYVIYNDQTLLSLREQVLKIYSKVTLS